MSEESSTDAKIGSSRIAPGAVTSSKIEGWGSLVAAAGVHDSVTVEQLTITQQMMLSISALVNADANFTSRAVDEIGTEIGEIASLIERATTTDKISGTDYRKVLDALRECYLGVIAFCADDDVGPETFLDEFNYQRSQMTLDPKMAPPDPALRPGTIYKVTSTSGRPRIFKVMESTKSGSPRTYAAELVDELGALRYEYSKGAIYKITPHDQMGIFEAEGYSKDIGVCIGCLTKSRSIIHSKCRPKFRS